MTVRVWITRPDGGADENLFADTPRVGDNIYYQYKMETVSSVVWVENIKGVFEARVNLERMPQ